MVDIAILEFARGGIIYDRLPFFIIYRQWVSGQLPKSCFEPFFMTNFFLILPFFSQYCHLQMIGVIFIFVSLKWSCYYYFFS